MIDVLPRGEEPTGAAAAVLHNVTLQVTGQAFLYKCVAGFPIFLKFPELTLQVEGQAFL
jgi:hypothetical protein